MGGPETALGLGYLNGEFQLFVNFLNFNAGKVPEGNHADDLALAHHRQVAETAFAHDA